MIILCKQKDYYDHVVSTWGRDELVVYDRRECFPIDPNKTWCDSSDARRVYPCGCSDYQNINIERWFKKEPIYGDKKRELVTQWNRKKVLESRKYEEETKGLSSSKKWKTDHEKVLEGQIYHFALEIGYHHYYFEVERYIDDDDESRVHLNYGLVEHKRIEKEDKISAAPMSLVPVVHERYHWLYNGEDKFVLGKDSREQKIDNPILFRTYIPKFIDPNEVWNNLYEYISSLRDKEFTDSRTNEQHIESNGFDKKISFRHRKKG